MIKNSAFYLPLILITLLFSAGLIVFALFAEAHVQGLLFVPGDLDFDAYIPGTYRIYHQINLGTQNQADIFADNSGINENLGYSLHGCGHLEKIKPGISNSGGSSYFIKDAKSGDYKIGIPIAEFEILWPGRYHIHAEFTNPVSRYTELTIGPTGLVSKAIIFSVLAQIAVLLIAIRSKLKLAKRRAQIEEAEQTEEALS